MGKLRIAPKFPRHIFFKRLLINNIELRDMSTRTICMTMSIRPKELWQIGNRKIRMFRDYLINRFYLQKINLKRPLSRGSRFKIYFRLKNWENRGSRQNFHGIPFFQRPHINKPELLHNIANLLWSHTYLRIKQFKSKHGCKEKWLRKLIKLYQNTK